MSTALEDFLQKYSIDGGELKHHGVKGMRWGVRKKTESTSVANVAATTSSSSTPTTSEHTPLSTIKVKHAPGKGLQGTEGGHKTPVHQDAVKVAAAKQLAKASTLDSLSNKDIQAVVTRMNLEKQYRTLNPPAPSLKRYVKGLLGDVANTEVRELTKGKKGPVMTQLDVLLAPASGGKHKK